MYKQILVNAQANEKRIALLEDGKLVELWVERDEINRIAGNIYKGIVKDVIPGIQSAFIDIGLEKAGFLHISEIEVDEKYILENLDIDNDDLNKIKRNLKIEELLREGDTVLVQVKREAIGSKGPKLTTQISLPGRYIVFIPDEDYIAVSRKIKEREERNRLKNIIRNVKNRNEGIIIRTDSEKKDDSAILDDFYYLREKWDKIQKKAEKAEAPSLIWGELEMTVGSIRDLFTRQIDCLVIDSYEEYKKIVNYLKHVAPDLIERIIYYDKEDPIFDAFDIEKDIEKMFHRKIWLKNGGYIIIEQTEALISIDVNTGKYTGKGNLEDTLYETNLLAAKEIARQTRLRDLGGIIVIDFIDMMNNSHKENLVNILREEFKNDRSPLNIYPLSKLGLVEMSRKRIRPNLMMTFSQVCPYCNGRGRVDSVETIIMKIERFLKRAHKKIKKNQIILDIQSEIYHNLMYNLERVKKWEKDMKIKISLSENVSSHIESFRVYILEKDQRVEITNDYKV